MIKVIGISKLPCREEAYRAFNTSRVQRSDREITDEVLGRGIETVSRAGQAKKKTYDLRTRKNHSITGAESMCMAMISVLLDHVEFSKGAQRVSRLRIFVVSSKDLPEREISWHGGSKYERILASSRLKVGWASCSSRTCKMTVLLGRSPRSRFIRLHQALNSQSARRNVRPNSCFAARRNRFQNELRLTKERRVDGVITVQQKWCHPHEGVDPELKRFLEKSGIRTFFLISK